MRNNESVKIEIQSAFLTAAPGNLVALLDDLADAGVSTVTVEGVADPDGAGPQQPTFRVSLTAEQVAHLVQLHLFTNLYNSYSV